ncbi:MAG: 50S ribosomal protein L4 [Rhizobiales bacterium]|nr:50S ribosomal protein L4 [Hyphomicrobiales bacterium]
MKVAVKTLDGADAGTVSIADDVFGLEPRSDILHRMVRYQLAKRRAGTHAVKNRADVVGSTRKFVKQKGSGGARHGNKKAPQFRGGGRAFGPVVRDHAMDLPKKVRVLALKHALSAKVKASELIVLEDANLSEGKTKVLLSKLKDLGVSNALVIDGAEVNENFARAAGKIINLDVLPVQGINVYDILRRDNLVLTKAALSALEERFK